MTFAGLIFAGVLGLLNLLLILLVARRVRLLSQRIPNAGRRPWLMPGTQVPDFDAKTSDGEVVSRQRLLGVPSVVGFFSTSCEPCRQQVPLFALYLAGERAPERAVAVIVGEDGDGFASQLSTKALVVRESQRGPMVQAFAANALPALYLLDADGKVVASGPGVGAIVDSHPGMAVSPL